MTPESVKLADVRTIWKKTWISKNRPCSLWGEIPLLTYVACCAWYIYLASSDWDKCALFHMALNFSSNRQQTCKALYAMTEDQQLWEWVFYHIIQPHVPYTRSITELAQAHLKAMAIHLQKLDTRTKPSSTLQPRFIGLNQPRSVTWLHIVRGKWLLVATSGHEISSISAFSCAEILRSATPKPFAKAFLPAPVSGGAVEFDGDIMLIALCLYTKRVPFHSASPY